ncbi:MAG: metallophosphoesterase, partial [Thermomicrobiales bacterium]
MPHQFIVYGDSCSGIPGAPHAATTAAVNRVVAALPEPDFVAFLGDEVMGLTSDEAALRAQWRYWLDHEMAWLDRARIPLYTVPANHTTYDTMSERVYAEVLDFLPANGPTGQARLSYWVRRGDLLLVFVNTMSTALGEGRVETDWLEATLRQHADAAHKLVLGHHPVFAANGFSGAYQRELEAENGRRFWEILRRHGVLAYLCSHMLAFDVQAHDGILQIMTAGAGTAHRLPPEWEYLHAVQMALDADGLRYRVLDTDGVTRESLAWPVTEPEAEDWGEIAASPGEPSPPAPLPMRGRGEPIR